MIYNYSNFLLENKSGTRNISEKEFDNLLKKHCKNFNWSDRPIYKSSDAVNGEYGFLDVEDIPNYYLHRNKFFKTKKLRKSAHMPNNTYTYLMNHLPSWKKFPKRQVVCSTNTINEFYQRIFRVIPFDNSKWGVVPSDDIQGDDIGLPLDFRKYIQHELGFEVKNFVDLNEIDLYPNDTFKNFKNAMEKSALDIKKFDKMLAPERFGFEAKTYKQLINYNFPNAKIDLYYDEDTPSNEVWTDSNVLLYQVPKVGEDELDSFLNDEAGEGYTREQAIDYLDSN